jgi:uncharacterized membrane protein YkoI
MRKALRHWHLEASQFHCRNGRLADHSRAVKRAVSRDIVIMKSVFPPLNPIFAGLALALCGVSALGLAELSAQDQLRSEQDEARKEIQAGTQLSLREIERRVLPQMQGSEYLGPAYDSTARAYRLKFIREGRVTYVDVDARSGRIISRSR